MNKDFWKIKNKNKFCEICKKIKIGQAKFFIDEKTKTKKIICKNCLRNNSTIESWKETNFITQNQAIEWKINENHSFYFSYLRKHGSQIDLETLGLKNIRGKMKEIDWKNNNLGSGFDYVVKNIKQKSIIFLNISSLGKRIKAK